MGVGFNWGRKKRVKHREMEGGGINNIRKVIGKHHV